MRRRARLARLARVLRCEVAGVPFTLRSDDPVALAGLAARWRALPRHPRRSALVLDALFRPRRPRLVVSGRSRLASRDPSTVLAALELAVYAELCARTEATPLHAAAVVWEGRGVALVGESGAGKSSLAWELCRRGATYLGDEHLFLEDRGARGFARALSFVAGGQVRVRFAPRVAPGCARVALVVLLEAERHEHAEPRALAPAEAAAHLARHLHRAPRATDLRRLVELTRSAQTMALGQRGIERAADSVLAALATQS
ncbi:MAG: hypothetical protein AB7N76_21330 [Planctomycetota bacterium]